MLKEAIQYVLENMRPEAQNLGNRAYIITQKGAQEVIETPIAPDTVPLHSLDSIVKMIRTEAIDTTLVRSGTWGSLWIDGEQVAECYGCQAKISKTKESVPRCRAMMEDSKLVSTKGTGSIRIYNATSRLIELEGEALKTGKDLRHTIISNLDDPDNPNNQRIALMGVSFDDLTLADWEAAKLGQIESPFTFNDYQMLDT